MLRFTMEKKPQLYQNIAGFLSCNLRIMDVLDASDVSARPNTRKALKGVMPAINAFHFHLGDNGTWSIHCDYMDVSGSTGFRRDESITVDSYYMQDVFTIQDVPQASLTVNHFFTKYLAEIENESIEVYELVITEIDRAHEFVQSIAYDMSNHIGIPLALESQSIKASISGAWMNMVQVSNRINKIESSSVNFHTMYGESITVAGNNTDPEDFHLDIVSGDIKTRVRAGDDYTLRLSEVVNGVENGLSPVDITHARISGAFGAYYSYYVKNKADLIFHTYLLKSAMERYDLQERIKRGEECQK